MGFIASIKNFFHGNQSENLPQKEVETKTSYEIGVNQNEYQEIANILREVKGLLQVLSEKVNPRNLDSSIKIVGCGGCGISFVNYIKSVCPSDGVYVSVDLTTDRKPRSVADLIILISSIDSEADVTEAIEQIFEDTKYLFVIAGLGGDTGSFLSMLIAKLAKERGIKTYVYLIHPFAFEGKMRLEKAQKTINEMKLLIDNVEVIDNEKHLRSCVSQQEVYIEEFFNDGYETVGKKIIDVLTKGENLG